MLKAYIVDDEPLARDEIKYLLQRSKQVEVLGESDCIDDAIIEIPRLKPDIVFLDIELTEGNGLNLAKWLESVEPQPAIVFATAYDEYALQAFDLNAADYLLKPINEARLHKTLEKLKQVKEINSEKPIQTHPEMNRNGKLAVMADERIVLITLTDIHLETFEGKCMIHTLKHKYIVSDALIVLEKKLNPCQFLRVHRSYIVNLDHVQEIEPWVNSTFNLIMKGEMKVPVSRTYVKELKKHIGF
ncbi:LytR/AlgR family response regulator transcription factor [Cytobacillus purgationiresistens]|uniref:Two-component system response regulator LytT n=1 Tax=Cytobacillus purgationiresistens TaxID=863449 RepID=A0ABU0AJN9_9BACI|nr:LytTR family DNA-binding domain-containing protein [Cytobacillus purgationiresistens]MDQ0271482.1 two-component system response regulator LytT [Cytobacillus purgationiresistens]